jgi:tetratricopeptide (TPR) repeat protein
MPGASSGRAVAAAVATLMLTLGHTPARASSASTELRARAASELYNLDQDRAIATFKQAIAADPEDAAAQRGLAIGLWMKISLHRGNMTVDDYLGGIRRQSVAGRPAPPEMAAAFNEALDRALALSRQRVAANPRDADARYQVGAALGLRASYIATVEGSGSGAFRAAREAYKTQEKTLELDRARKDAGLIIGTYRYIISALGLPARLVAYMAGLGGDKARGIRMVEEAVAYGGENQDDARFTLVLMFNREKRYDEALKQLDMLRERHPRNRLMWFETGSTALRAGRPAEAERILTEGLARFADDERTRMFGEQALWLYKRGAARAALGRNAEAEQDLGKAVGLEGRKWVIGRAHLELGKLRQLAGDGVSARRELEAAILLCDADNDHGTADEARRLLQ